MRNIICTHRRGIYVLKKEERKQKNKLIEREIRFVVIRGRSVGRGKIIGR